MKTVFEMKSDLSNLSQTVISVEETLKSIGAKSKDIKKAVLLTEEMLVLLGRNDRIDGVFGFGGRARLVPT